MPFWEALASHRMDPCGSDRLWPVTPTRIPLLSQLLLRCSGSPRFPVKGSFKGDTGPYKGSSGPEVRSTCTAHHIHRPQSTRGVVRVSSIQITWKAWSFCLGSRHILGDTFCLTSVSAPYWMLDRSLQA